MTNGVFYCELGKGNPPGTFLKQDGKEAISLCSIRKGTAPSAWIYLAFTSK